MEIPINKVINDGECPVCSSMTDFTEDQLEDHNLAFVAFQEEDFERATPNLSKDEAS